LHIKGNLLFFLFITVLPFLSCKSTKRVPEGKHLLVKNKIEIIGKNHNIDISELESIIKQKPNKRILGILRFHLSVYNLADNGKESKVRNYFKNTIGEKPVILDSMLTLKSTNQLKLYLFKKGYFNVEVKDTTVYHKKKAIVTYKITPHTPYRINQIFYEIAGSSVRSNVLPDTINSKIKSGDIYDEDVLSDERDRITQMLKNSGFYDFSSEFIHYAVDSNLNNHKVNIYLKIYNPPSADTTIILEHQKHYIHKIYIIPNYDSKNPRATYKDTLFYNGYYFLYNNELLFRPSIIAQHIFFKENELYIQRNVDETFKKLNNLKAFRVNNIVFNKINNSEVPYLDCYIFLSPFTKQTITTEVEGISRAGTGQLGTAANLVYVNRNLFNGAENLEVKLRGGIEFQPSITDVNNQNITGTTFNYFNTQEWGPEINLLIPKFLLPVKPERFSKYFTPNTKITALYNFQENLDFRRRIFNLSYGYTWKETATKQHFLNPIEINLVNIDQKISLSKFLESIPNPFIRNSYISHITIGGRYTFIYNNQDLKKARNFIYFRGSLEGAGNLLHLLHEASNQPKDSLDRYLIFNTPFAHFIKTDYDFRNYFGVNNHQKMVARIAFGIGVPLKNLNVLPIEKSYFGGGSNGIRAWIARSLGPGAYDDSTGINAIRLGDMNIEGNLEYRFDLLKFIKGALFLDAGNIWILKPDPLRPNAEFKFDTFLSQMALGAGTGIRFDFNFFIFRLDIGNKIYDPSLKYNDRWVIRKIFDTEWKNQYTQTHNNIKYRFTTINFGIGYPF
jgi:hypothetical protein